MMLKAAILPALGAGTLIAASGCVTAPPQTAAPALTDTATHQKYERDRQAILGMAGDFTVNFDFIETVSFVDGYEIKDRKLSGGDEIVRVIEDRGNFISLQHILVVGGEEKFPVKHWRQDWRYEPQSVLTYVGGNAWEKRELSPAEAKGKWSQVVYQVDDAPRYGALGAWSHEDGVSQWTPPTEWRPLPRRDATTRDDYHALNAVNRHAITPFGWVHEQDNSKVILTGTPQILVREIAINTYRRNSDFDVSVGDDYWAATEDFWAGIRAEWTRIETKHEAFGLTIQGEPEALYMPILGLANYVVEGEMTADEAVKEAQSVIADYVTTEIGAIDERLSKVSVAQVSR